MCPGIGASLRGAQAAEIEMVSREKRRLVLHVDVNETIMIGDPVAGLDYQASLNNVIAKAAIVKSGLSGDVWHDGSALDPSLRPEGSEPPPLLSDFHLPEGHTPYFKTYRRHKDWPAFRFTEPGMPGEIYRPIFEKMQALLKWPHEPNKELAPHGHHLLLPSFFHTIRELQRRGREFSLVVRTYGTDLPEIAVAISAFASGRHPSFPDAASADLQLDASDARWVLRRRDRTDMRSQIQLSQYDNSLGTEGLGSDLGQVPTLPPAEREIQQEEDIVKLLAQKRVIGVRDDYFFWKGHGYLPQAGKPCWLTPYDRSVQHIFFDDNIHNDPLDSIVAIRTRGEPDGDFAPLSGEATRGLEGVMIVKARPVDAVLDMDYFLKHIARCEENFSRQLESGELGKLAAQSAAAHREPAAKVPRLC